MLAYFEISAEAEVDTSAVIANVKELEAAGYVTDPSQVTEQTGYQVERKAASPAPGQPEDMKEQQKGQPPVRNRAAKPDALSDGLGVPESWTAPVADLWRELEAKVADKSVTDQDFLAFLESAAERLPELFGEMDVDGLAEVMEAGMGAAAVEGVRIAMSKRRKKS